MSDDQCPETSGTLRCTMPYPHPMHSHDFWPDQKLIDERDRRLREMDERDRRMEEMAQVERDILRRMSVVERITAGQSIEAAWIAQQIRDEATLPLLQQIDDLRTQNEGLRAKADRVENAVLRSYQASAHAQSLQRDGSFCHIHDSYGCDHQ